MIKHFLAITCLTLSIGANAALVDNITYVTDTDTNKDYLKLSDYMAGMSYMDLYTFGIIDGLPGESEWAVTPYYHLQSLINADPYGAYELINGGNDTVVTACCSHWTDPNSFDGQWAVPMGYVRTVEWRGPLDFNQHGISIYDANSNWYNYAISLWRPSAVPIPAAGWLFMSALIGLIGKKRLSRR